MNLSVITVTHNPREDYLRRTLAALEAQTLDRDAWELVVVDNASSSPLASQWPLAWHPRARVVREDRLGVAIARLRGIAETTADIIVYVDDDNVLEPNYLEEALAAFRAHPFIGIASGKVVGEYEEQLPPWLEPYLSHLAIVDRGERELYALYPGFEPFVPHGAGMVFRRSVAACYADLVHSDPLRPQMGEVGGGKLSRAEDSDLALCAFDLSLAKAYFPQLRLTHLIPARRFQMDYLLRLLDDGTHSGTTLSLVRGLLPPPVPVSSWRRWAQRGLHWLRERGMEPHQIKLERAKRRGQERALAEYATHAKGIPANPLSNQRA